MTIFAIKSNAIKTTKIATDFLVFIIYFLNRTSVDKV